MGITLISALSIIAIIIVVFSVFNEKVLKLPTEIGLMTISFSLSGIVLFCHYIGFSFVPEISYISNFLDLHDIIMNGLICFLLFSGAAKIRFVDLADDRLLISSLAFFSTLISAIIYGALVFIFAKIIGFNMNILQACMLGSIIAPTDPVSAMSILKKAGMSKRLSLIVEGESLFNDGIAVALFVTFSAMNKSLSGTSPFITFIETIVYNVIGAILVGFVVSIPLFILFKITKQKHIEVLVSVSAVTAAYSISEHFGVSAPIAAVVVGMYFATKMNKLHRDYEDYYTNFYGFWDVIDKTFNGILYILIGFAILYLHNMENFLIIMITAIIIGLIARYLSLIIPVYLFSKNRSMDNHVYIGETKRKTIWSIIELLTWGGLKGGISIALALGMSGKVNADIYNFIVASTYSVVAFSILVQGLTIKKVYSKLNRNIAD